MNETVAPLPLTQKQIEDIYLSVPPSTDFWWRYAKAIEAEVRKQYAES